MKKIIYILFLLLACNLADAAPKVNDPIVMTVGGIKVPHSEFETFYKKNSQLTTDTTSTFDDYVEMFVVYKLKVAEALSRGIDTTLAFRDEFETYRQQLVASFRDEDYATDSLVRELLERLPYEIHASHILLNVAADAPDSQVDATRAKIEGFRQQIESGTPFDSLAHVVSDCPSKAQGGDLGYFRLLQMVYPFEDAAFSTPTGGMTICRSQFGFHLIKVADRRRIPTQNLNPIIKEVLEGGEPGEELLGQLKMAVTHDEDRTKKAQRILEERFPESEILENPEYKALYKEYYDGILLFDVANKEVWEKANTDQKGLTAYFAEHKDSYRFEKPRFKGAFIECANDEALVSAMKKIYENNAMKEAADLVRSTILTDSILTPEPRKPRFHIVNGLFKPGDNPAVDEKLGLESEKKVREDFPVQMVYGNILTVPDALEDVRNQVVADYQDELEKAFVNKLKAKFKVKINKKELNKIEH